MKAPLSYVPLLLPLIAVITGVLLCDFICDDTWFGLLLLAPIAICFAKKLRILLPFFGLILIGWITTCVTKPNLDIADTLDEKAIYSAEIHKTVENEYGYRLTATINAQNKINIKPFDAVVFINGFDNNFKAGDIIDFTAKFKPLTFETELPDEICNDKNYFRHGISVKAYPDSVCINGFTGGIKGFLYDIKNNAIDKILFSELSEDLSAFLIATIFGDTSFLKTDTRNMFSATGLAHILALSGMHVAIIILALHILLFPLTIFRLHNTRIIITIILIWAYAVMTMLSPSVTRAVIMATFVLVSYLLYRQNIAFNALCGAALLILIFNPYSLYNIGFQLSFAAVAGILLLHNRLNPFKQGTIFHKIAASFVLPIAAVAATTPLVIYHFHQFPTYFLITAPIFTPILSFIITVGIFMLLIGFPFDIITHILNYTYDIVIQLISLLAKLPNANITGLYISPISAFLMICLVPTIAAWINYKKNIYGLYVLCIISAIATITIFTKKEYPDCEYYLTHNPFSTEIVIKEKDTLHIVTTAKQQLASTVKNNAEYKYADYMALRNISRLNIVTDSLSSEYVIYRKPLLIIGTQKIILADANYTTDSAHCDILVICRGFRGDCTKLISQFSPDKIIFSADLNHKLRKRYEQELKNIGRQPTDY